MTCWNIVSPTKTIEYFGYDFDSQIIASKKVFNFTKIELHHGRFPGQATNFSKQLFLWTLSDGCPCVLMTIRFLSSWFLTQDFPTHMRVNLSYTYFISLRWMVHDVVWKQNFYFKVSTFSIRKKKFFHVWWARKSKNFLFLWLHGERWWNILFWSSFWGLLHTWCCISAFNNWT